MDRLATRSKRLQGGDSGLGFWSWRQLCSQDAAGFHGCGTHNRRTLATLLPEQLHGGGVDGLFLQGRHWRRGPVASHSHRELHAAGDVRATELSGPLRSGPGRRPPVFAGLDWASRQTACQTRAGARFSGAAEDSEIRRQTQAQFPWPDAAQFSGSPSETATSPAARHCWTRCGISLRAAGRQP
jgi:hypothetical protein